MAKSLVEDVRANNKEAIEIARIYFSKIRDTITLHKAVIEGLADEVVLEGSAFKKDGGLQALDAMLELTTDEDGKKEVSEMRQYWDENYDSIKRIVYKD
ncbi:hypothetical protein GOV12_06025 [Candidatus Pacearchaeota archaeon]|nr:hypothetical protein [Candidatus Pacearchaeota archaeon]